MASRFARFSGFLARVDARADAADVRVVCTRQKGRKCASRQGICIPAASTSAVEGHIRSSRVSAPKA